MNINGGANASLDPLAEYSSGAGRAWLDRIREIRESLRLR